MPLRKGLVLFERPLLKNRMPLPRKRGKTGFGGLVEIGPAVVYCYVYLDYLYDGLS